MFEIRGNLWNVAIPRQVTVITTNGVVRRDGACVMGRGCAQQARDMFPGIDHLLGTYIEHYGNRPFDLGRWSHLFEGNTWQYYEHIVSLPVKHHWHDTADINLIRRGLHALIAMADKYEWTSILIPRPGCGNGQLSWDHVRIHCDTMLDDRFTVITF